MKSPLSQRGTGAFTLVEMLVVIAIIGILAALLLPALEGGKARARLVGCQSNLGQLALAFHSFAHDHDSKFPMQVSVTQGGAQEFVQNGQLINGEFYFAYRIFQSLSDDLGTPKLLLCPTDTRLPATNFISLRNKNVSYFVDVDADYNQPESILLGDRNLVSGPGRSLYSVGGQPLRWSGIMHQYKGNLLFADGHVEEAKGFSLAGGGRAAAQNVFFMPSVKGEEVVAQPAAADQTFTTQANSASPGSPGPDNSISSNPPARPAPVVFSSQSLALNHASTGSSARTPIADVSPTDRVTAVQIQIVTNTATATNDNTGMSNFNRRLVKVFQHVFIIGYALLLLLCLLWLYFKLRREWERRQQRRQKTSQPLD